MAQLSHWFRKPDWALAVVFAALAAPSFVPGPGVATAVGQALSDDVMIYNLGSVVIVFTLLGCFRLARPRAGALIGLAVMSVPLLMLVLNYLPDFRAGYFPWEDLLIGALIAAAGCVLGALAGLAGRLVGRRKRGSVVVELSALARPKAGALLVVVTLLLVVALSAEAVVWALQSSTDFVITLSNWVYIVRGDAFARAYASPIVRAVLVDRLLVIAPAALAVYMLLRRMRAARALVVTWGLVGLVLAVLRVPFFHALGLPEGAWAQANSTGYSLVNGVYIEPPFAWRVMFDIMRLEVPIRAALCVVGLPYVLLSKRLKEDLGSPRSGSVAATPDIPAQS